MTAFLQRSMIPLATGAAAAAFTAFQADRSGAPETGLLGFLATVCLWIVATVPDPGARQHASVPGPVPGAVPVAALLVTGLLLAVPAGPARATAISAILLLVVLREFVRTNTTGASWKDLARRWVPLAAALGMLARPELLVVLEIDGPQPLPQMILWWLVIPGLLSVVVASAMARAGRKWPRLVAAPPVAAACVAAFPVLLLAGYPWMSPTPVRAALHATGTLFRSVDPIIVEPVALAATSPTWRHDLDPAPARAILIDTYLAHAGAEPGAVAILVEATLTDGSVVTKNLRIGRETDDWSADSPSTDRAGPRLQQLSGNGHTFARRWRTRIELPPAATLGSVHLRRPAERGETMVAVVTWLGVER